VQEKERKNIKPEDLSDEDIEKGLKTLGAVKQARYRKANPYTRVCIGCGLQMTEKEYEDMDTCQCGGTKTVKLKEST